MKPILLVLIIALAGCATKHYGREQPLTDVERQEYTCREIRIELSKIQAFDDRIQQEGQFNFKTVTGVMSDFGIGNGNEKRSAIKSSRDRKNQLLELAKQRECQNDAVDLKPKSPGA